MIPTSWPVSLISAVPKRHLFDDVVRKLSEIGAARVVPVQTERSVVNPGPNRVERWRKIAAESLRQCGRQSPIEVDEVQPLEEALNAHKGLGTGFVLHPSGSASSLVSALDGCDPAKPIAAVIGPEGGLTKKEVDLAVGLGFQKVGLGQAVMRVETAAIAAAVLFVAHLGGFEPVK